MLSQTPLVMNLIGAPFVKLYVNPHVFDGMFPGKARQGHHEHPEMTASVLKQLPHALTNPIAVFKSYNPSEKKYRSGSFVFMLRLLVNGATVVVPVKN